MHTVLLLKPMPVITVSVDMMDTGVDVPDVVNLVFFKQVRSKIKFWQMIGRGTRLSKNLDCVDGDEEYIGKRYFRIFDYCGNFAFFREHTNIVEDKMASSISERIFARKAELIRAFQTGSYVDDPQIVEWRTTLVNDLSEQIASWDTTKVAVRLKREYVERYRDPNAFTALNELNVRELTGELAPLAHYDEDDVYALRFDALMYGLMVACVSGGARAAYDTRIRAIAVQLNERMTIPQISKQKEIINAIINDDKYVASLPITELEHIRICLRDLVRFIADSNKKRVIITDLADPLISRVTGASFKFDEHYEDYELKVNRYIVEHADDTPIYKLRHNQPLDASDYSELERVLIELLGTEDEYRAAYGDTTFGLLVRRIGKLDHAAAMEAFAEFINKYTLNQAQISFLHKIVEYIEQNGYLEPDRISKPPFDRPRPIFKLFNTAQAMDLVMCIRKVESNALVPEQS